MNVKPMEQFGLQTYRKINQKHGSDLDKYQSQENQI